MKKLVPIMIAVITLIGCRQTVRKVTEVIYLRDGEEYTGYTDRISADSVWFSAEGATLALAKTDVRGIDIPQPREGDDWHNISDITDPFLRKILKNFTPPESDAKYIDLYVEHNITLNDDGSSTHTSRVIRYVNAESGKGSAANNSWGYLSDRSYARLDFARSYSPDGSVNHINESAINRISRYPVPAEYSNYMQIQIAVPESQVGSILDFQFSTTQDVIDSIHPCYHTFIFQSSSQPIIEEIIRVVQPVDGPLAFYGVDIPDPEKQTSRGKEILTWTIRNQIPQRQEYYTPPPIDYLPYLIVASSASWNDIALHLRGSLEQADVSDTIISAVADSLTDGLVSEDEKAHALYEFVCDDIRMAGPGMYHYSYVPTPPEEILLRRFANNLDRVALLYSLMQNAGLEVDLVYIRNSASGQLIPSFPAIGQLNYALVMYNNNIYLDPRPNTPFGTLFNQETLGLSIETGKLKETPLNHPHQEATQTRIYATLNPDGTLYLTKEFQTSGQNTAFFKAYLADLTPDEIRQDAEELATSIHPNARLVDYNFSGVEILNENVSYEMTVNIPAYATRAGDYLIFYLPGIEHSAYQVGASDRISPIDRDIRSQDVTSIEIELPAGTEIVYKPQDVSLSTSYDSYTAEFRNDVPGRLFLTETEKVLAPVIPPEDYLIHKELVLKMAQMAQEPIILKF